ncbi:DNA adenine methylase [Cellulomonas sp. Y8]|uniref:DNA adenine methylase n=1 Tax=Cellulomonas sp. Y8 TaxID=2591145 RepID=UPI003D707A18
MIPVTTARPNLDSPLRYPGGKSSLTRFLARCVDLMQTDDVTYVEPYAGGAGAGVSLLIRDRVARVVINDLDPAVHSFWRAVIEAGDALRERVLTVPLTVDEWARQREIYRAGRRNNWLDLGFAFFYLNRTNRSGVLNAGVIGGQKQLGKYKIDARFNREQLAERIGALYERRDRISLHDIDGRRLIETYASKPSTFIYADPPYVRMGSTLYMNAFSEMDHTLLATCLERNRGAWWFLTYDDDPLVRQLYARLSLGQYTLNWAARNQGLATELYVASDPLAAALSGAEVSSRGR